MTRKTRLFAWTVSLLTMIAPVQAGEIETLEGTANFIGDERVPEGAVLEVDLLDLSRVGEKARMLSRMRFEIEDRAPVPFALPYDSALIEFGGRYSLQARIIQHGPKRDEVLWRSTAVLPVLGPGLDPKPEVLMDRVIPVASGGTPVGHRWRMARVEGVERLGFTKARMTFGDEGVVSGNAGCNKFKAEYTIDGDKLTFAALNLTKRGCQPEIMRRERLFIQATKRTVAYRREQDVLRLLDIDGLETMRLDRE